MLRIITPIFQTSSGLFMHLLKHDTGKAAVVLPDGFLFGEGTKTNFKRELLEEFNLHTIVRLPKGVFSPYTSIATNSLSKYLRLDLPSTKGSRSFPDLGAQAGAWAPAHIMHRHRCTLPCKTKLTEH